MVGMVDAIYTDPKYLEGVKTMDKLVSILIPCYNHEKYIDSCLKSLIAQSYKNIELLICDDCSRDTSFAKLLAWKPLLESRFSRVELYKNEKNQGVCKTLNGLINRSRGEYIKTLASDDMLRPDAISDYVEFSKLTEFDIVFSNAYIINEHDTYPVDESIERRKYYSSIPPRGNRLTSKLIAGNYIQGASLFIRRETFEKFGVFDEQYLYEDWEYLLRVSVSGTIEYMDKIPVYYRILDGSLSNFNSSSEEGRKKYRIFYSDMKKLFEKYNEYTSKESNNITFNQTIRTAVILHDHVLLDAIIKDMRALGLNVFFGNKIRIISLKIGIYNLLRYIKNSVKRETKNGICNKRNLRFIRE